MLVIGVGHRLIDYRSKANPLLRRTIEEAFNFVTNEVA